MYTTVYVIIITHEHNYIEIRIIMYSIINAWLQTNSLPFLLWTIYVTPIHAIITINYLSQQVVPETHDSFHCH